MFLISSCKLIVYAIICNKCGGGCNIFHYVGAGMVGSVEDKFTWGGRPYRNIRLRRNFDFLLAIGMIIGKNIPVIGMLLAKIVPITGMVGRK